MNCYHDNCCEEASIDVGYFSSRSNSIYFFCSKHALEIFSKSHNNEVGIMYNCKNIFVEEECAYCSAKADYRITMLPYGCLDYPVYYCYICAKKFIENNGFDEIVSMEKIKL